MIGMLLNVVHGQVQKNQRKHITKESKGFHNHSTLILILQFDLNIWFRASGPETLTRLWRLPWQEPCPALPWATGTILRLTHSWLGLCPKQFALSWLLTYLVPRSHVDEAVNKIACVAGVWKGREREFARETRGAREEGRREGNACQETIVFSSLLPRAPLAFLSRLKLPFPKLPFPSLLKRRPRRLSIRDLGMR